MFKLQLNPSPYFLLSKCLQDSTRWFCTGRMFRVSEVRLWSQHPHSLHGLASFTLSFLGYHMLWTSQANMGRMSGNLVPKAIQIFPQIGKPIGQRKHYSQDIFKPDVLMFIFYLWGNVSGHWVTAKGWAITDLQMLPRKISFIRSVVCFLFGFVFSSFHSWLIFFWTSIFQF